MVPLVYLATFPAAVRYLITFLTPHRLTLVAAPSTPCSPLTLSVVLLPVHPRTIICAVPNFPAPCAWVRWGLSPASGARLLERGAEVR